MATNPDKQPKKVDKYKELVKAQDERERLAGLYVMLRTYISLIMGIFSYCVYCVDEFRLFNMGFGLSQKLQALVNLPNFIILDILLIAIADQTQKSYDNQIKLLLSDSKSESEKSPNNNLDKMMDFADQISQFGPLQKLIKFYGFFKNIQLLVQDILVFVIGMFIIDGVICMLNYKYTFVAEIDWLGIKISF